MTKEGDYVLSPDNLATANDDYGQNDALIIQPQPQLPSVADQSYIENCSKFADALLLAAERTFDHFIKTGSPRPKLKRKDNLSGVEKTIEIVGKSHHMFGGKHFEADLKFSDTHRGRPPPPSPAKQNKFPAPPRIGMPSRPIGGGYEDIGSFRASYTNILNEIKDPEAQQDMAKYISRMVKQSDKYINQNSNDTHRVQQIALKCVEAALDETFNAAPAPNRNITTSSKAATSLSSGLRREIELLSDALTQTINRTLDDLIPSSEKRPVIDSKIETFGTRTIIKIDARRKSLGMKLQRDFKFSVSFDTALDAKLYHNTTGSHQEGDPNWGATSIPLNTSDSNIVDLIDDAMVEKLIEQICSGIQYRDRILNKDNLAAAKQLPEIVKDHLQHALAGSFGSALISANQPLILASFDTDDAHEEFRNELKDLTKSKSSDVYLLTIFGISAMAKSAETSSIISEWQTGRAIEMPPTMEKIRYISTTLKSLNTMSGEDRAQNAKELLSQIRSMQKTVTRDLANLSEDAKSIHSAKTVMAEHERNLQSYIQGFETVRPSLTEKFGEASVQEKSLDLSTALAAVQIHEGAQEFTHESLSARMIRNLSSLSTRMSFVSQSMGALVAKTVEASIKADADDIEDDIAADIELLLKTFEPLAEDVAEIQTQLALPDHRNPLLMITHHSQDMDLEQ